MNRYVFLMLFSSFLVGCSYSVDTWVSSEDEPIITEQHTEEYWNKKGYFDGPCGWVKQEKVSTLPSLNSNGFLKGTDVVVEFADDNKILKEISVPANSMVIGADENSIYTNIGLKIGSDGSLSKASLELTSAKPIECPVAMIEYFGGSDYLICTEFELDNQTSRLFAFQGSCT
ncbi:hypothetical protein [Vibrio sp. OPT18]|uniref:hypothetical protein n=1 Tax=Vibrio sp. OPT18 TaxID=2778641 RepID=UPI00187DF271|nr:hypothetical protein [Vibrio sp. OPT18]MBE8577873.1 hypothetical protein [Vibrio sp. OPT18]